MTTTRAPTYRELPLSARLFIPATVGMAVAAIATAQAMGADVPLDPLLLVAALALCAAGNLFEVFAPANFSFQPNLIVFFAAAVLLPPWAVAALAVACYVPGWLVHRFPWYMVTFNVANYAIAGVVAQLVAGLGGQLSDGWSPTPGSTAALAAAAAAFVLVNHGLIACVVCFARGRPLRRAVDDMLACVPIDAALALTGACTAALWAVSPSLAILVAGPTALVYRALWVPLLQHRSRTDPKTGLYHSEYFQNALEDALAGAKRSGMPLSLLMLDLDQLRLVNNRHGHLAGDHLIRAVADALSEAAREQDGIAARFGGDELCLLLPGMGLEKAKSIADGVRRRIAEIEVTPDEVGVPLVVTASVGIASYPEHAETVTGLLEAADRAVRDAKLGGRNRTRTALGVDAQNALEIRTARGSNGAHPRVGAAPALDLPLGVPDEPPAPTAPEQPEPALDQEPAAGPEAEEESESDGTSRPWATKAYVAGLVVAALVVGALSDFSPIPASPWLFGLLVASVVLLDAARIDVFERANLSPASVPELALAFFFGPLGPLVAEGVIALIRMARHVPAIKWCFDFGALSLSGAGAAAVFAALPNGDSGMLLVGAGLAGIAYYIVNSCLLAIVMGLSEVRSPLAVWRERLAWMVPHYLGGGIIAGVFIISVESLGLWVFAVFGLPILMLWIGEKQYLDRSRATVGELRTANDELAATNERLRALLGENRELLGRMHRSYVTTITSLARTVEAKDPYTAGHTERVADIAIALAEELGFDESQLPAINMGAVIHDIGKVGIPDAILLKPGPLTDEEWKKMREHTELSSYIIAELELPAAVKQMARSHHERYDGGGYPDGLRGEEIPLAARILTVADSVDAMISDRPYRSALPLDVALTEVQDNIGSQFCPRVAAALMSLSKRQPALFGETPAEAPSQEAPTALPIS